MSAYSYSYICDAEGAYIYVCAYGISNIGINHSSEPNAVVQQDEDTVGAHCIVIATQPIAEGAEIVPIAITIAVVQSCIICKRAMRGSLLWRVLSSHDVCVSSELRCV